MPVLFVLMELSAEIVGPLVKDNILKKLIFENKIKNSQVKNKDPEVENVQLLM